MNLSEVQNLFKHPQKAKLLQVLSHLKVGNPIALNGLLGASLPILTAEAFSKSPAPLLVIFPNREQAAFFYHDVEKLLREEKIELVNRHVLFFPASFNRNYKWEDPDLSNQKMRSEMIDKLLFSDDKLLMITYSEAIAEKLLDSNYLLKNSFTLKVEEELPIDILLEFLYQYEYQREDFVCQPGQFAWRGSIFDIFSYAEEHPIRIEFEDEKIVSIRYFDGETQRSVKEIDSANIIPNISANDESENRVPFFNFLKPDTQIWVENIELIANQMETLGEKAMKIAPKEATLEEYFITSSEFLSIIGQKPIVKLNEYQQCCSETFTFDIKSQHHFAKNFNLLLEEWIDNYEKGYKTIFLSENAAQHERIRTVVEDFLMSYNVDNHTDYHVSSFYIPIDGVLHEGFRDESSKLCLYTDHQFFEKYHRFTPKDRYKKNESFTLKEIYDLQPGDFIVHVDHGIGVYQGLMNMEVNGKLQEVIKLSYKEGDSLFISIHSLHKISKYVGKEGVPPTLHRLGSGVWERAKERAKQRVKELVIDLVKLYAQRKMQKGFAFSPDSYLQTELEASFMYEDTPDQLKTTEEVKADMEKPVPMERLICGDVGFGKTEIAVRAAFKAVCDSKQVAVLVPTTVLALQHYNTFVERLGNFPCKVNYLNRFKTAKEIKEILSQLKNGQVDIIIGTHRLLSKDVEFKDLGLLIIDEEQKFGVAAKEKLRELRATIDTLTMSATPIPRTLQFSLMGVRDISVIATPPPNRYPIQTEVHEFDLELIKEAITFEISRGGQVFFVNNKVQNIYEIADQIRELVPEAKVGIGHGQMEGVQLEKVMLDFMQGNYDVLVATTIIESGLDIANANTMIINDAQNYALNVLHQLRGRVGRNNKQAFCYLYVKNMANLTDVARRRLKAIEEFSEIGSGFQIAMRDLDIRGAGDILGAEQSGFVNEIGLEMYQKILNEAILELQETHVGNEMADNSALVQRECLVETDLGLRITDEYVTSVSERMSLYKELNAIHSDEELSKFSAKLVDIFGEIPPETQELLKVVKLKRIALRWHIEKIVLKNGNLIGYFAGNNNSPFFQTEDFSKVLAFLQKFHPRVEMKENNHKLQLIIKSVKNVSSAIVWLEKIV